MSAGRKLPACQSSSCDVMLAAECTVNTVKSTHLLMVSGERH